MFSKPYFLADAQIASIECADAMTQAAKLFLYKRIWNPRVKYQFFQLLHFNNNHEGKQTFGFKVKHI